MTMWWCRFWNCSERAQQEESWCREHLDAFRRGLLDDCPNCGFGKYRRYSFCLRCRRAATARPWKDQSPGPSMNGEFHVYVLQLEGGGFLAGYSSDLRVRLMEHRDGVIPPTAGCSPQLVWFTLVESRAEARALKGRLRRLCDDDPEELRRWILQFQDLVWELRLL